MRPISAREDPRLLCNLMGVKPELRQLVVVFDIYMRRLITISGVKKETVRTDSENGWHYLGFIAFFSGEKE